MRSYELGRMPAVAELTHRNAADAARELAEAIGRELRATMQVHVDGSCLVLPAPFEVRRDGRALPGEEYATYANLCLDRLRDIGAGAVRFAVEEMYVFDWDVFDKQCWAVLQAAYEELPAWVGTKERPEWFGLDQRKGPNLSASVEPPGLQVAGVLELSAFDEWHHRMLERTRQLPVRSSP